MADHRDARVAATQQPGRGGSPTQPPATTATRESVLMVGQRSLITQRHGRFVAGSAAHPTRMVPDLAAALIRDYTQPGDWVLDPLAGIGTTLVEAVHASRNAFGVEIEPGWVALARANVALAHRDGGMGTARVVTADATRLPRGIPTALRGRFRLVLTSPPHRRTMYGPVEHRRSPLGCSHTSHSTPRRRPANSPDRPSPAHLRRVGVVAGLTTVLESCQPLLAPGGIIAVVSRTWRHDGRLVDLPGQVINAGWSAGLDLVQDRQVSHAAACDGWLVTRHGFYQLRVARRVWANGRTVCLPGPDHVAIFRRPPGGDPVGLQ